MATSLYSDFKVYEPEFQSGFVETLQQNIMGFNEASRGAIQLNTEALVGHYRKEAFWDEVSSISRRNIASTSDVTATKLTQDEFISVKANRRNGPYETTLDALRKIGYDAREFSRVVGEQTAVAVPREMLNIALAAAEAKLDATAALEYDATDGTITTADLIQGLKKAGDSAGDIVLWVMHSASWFDLLAEQYGTSSAIFSSDSFGAQLFGGTPATLNRPVLVTDSASLVESQGVSSAADAYSILGLKRGAISIEMSESPIAVFEGPYGGKENLYVRWQAEYAYNLGLRGCAWNTGTGINPTDVAIATGSNWVTKVADNKLLPGIIVKAASQ